MSSLDETFEEEEMVPTGWFPNVQLGKTASLREFVKKHPNTLVVGPVRANEEHPIFMMTGQRSPLFEEFIRRHLPFNLQGVKSGRMSGKNVTNTPCLDYDGLELKIAAAWSDGKTYFDFETLGLSPGKSTNQQNASSKAAEKFHRAATFAQSWTTNEEIDAQARELHAVNQIKKSLYAERHQQMQRDLDMNHDGLRSQNECSQDNSQALNTLGHELTTEVISLLTEVAAITAMRLRTNANDESVGQIGYTLGNLRGTLRDVRRQITGCREQLIGVNFKAAKAA